MTHLTLSLLASSHHWYCATALCNAPEFAPFISWTRRPFLKNLNVGMERTSARIEWYDEERIRGWRRVKKENTKIWQLSSHLIKIDMKERGRGISLCKFLVRWCNSLAGTTPREWDQDDEDGGKRGGGNAEGRGIPHCGDIDDDQSIASLQFIILLPRMNMNYTLWFVRIRAGTSPIGRINRSRRLKIRRRRIWTVQRKCGPCLVKTRS